jgi:putative RecB family exonuclease
MCESKSEGGRRCAYHTRPKFQAALASFANKEPITDKITEAVVAFAATPSGSEEVAVEITSAEASGDLAKTAWLSNALKRGTVRAEAMKEAKATVKAQISGPKAGSQPKLLLSPSRANDFNRCPLYYRYRTIDKLPEPKTSAPVRGTLVHSVLEKMFETPREDRTLENVTAMLPGEWDAMVAAHPEFADLLDETGDTGWLQGAADLVEHYFHMEDPARAPEGEREQLVEYRLSDDLVIRGFVDRLDIHPTKGIRIVDYKTGKSPKLGFEDKAFFQLRFYALAIWKARGILPTELQLMYLGDGQILRDTPTEKDLIETEKQIFTLWTKIQAAMKSGEFKPKKSGLCRQCSFQAQCPIFGGVIPPMPSKPVVRSEVPA